MGRIVSRLAASLVALAAIGCGASKRPDGAASASGSKEEDGAAPDASCCDAEGEPIPTPEAEAKRLGYPRTIENDLGMRFTLIPHGEFWMGSPKDEPGRADDEHRHEAKIFSPYYLGTSQVTVAQWAKGPILLPSGAGPADGPVTGITHAEAFAYAKWLTEHDPKWVYRIPTEAEWERAARAGGDAALLPAKGPNAWGVDGLADGVGEWVKDGYEGYPDWEVTNPWGGEGPGDRVVRGLSTGAMARAAARAHADPAERRQDVGVRLLAKLSYGKANEGVCIFAFRTVETDEWANVLGEKTGYEVRLVAVADRLESRQHLIKPLPWVRIPVLKSPFEVHVPPGRYYAQCQRVEDGKMVRGIELKLSAAPGRQAVDLPIPRPGAILNEPE